MPGKVIDRNLKLIKEKTGVYAEFTSYNSLFKNGKKRVKRLVTPKEANVLRDLLKKKEAAAADIDNYIYFHLL